MQLLALFVLRTTLKQCENLTDDILMKKLEISKEEVHNLIDVLHKEHVIRLKYTFQCPKCEEMNTLYEKDFAEATDCQFCGETISVQSLIKESTIRYVLDKSDFCEYMEENYREELVAAKKGESPRPRVVPFSQVAGTASEEDVLQTQSKESRLFISHCTKDTEYVKEFVRFLEAIGMPEGSIFCSSVEGYKIEWGQDIYDYLETEFNNINKNLIVLFMLSENYYNSTPCLNEMGATWVLKKEYRSVLLPGFEYTKIEGAIDAKKVGIKFDNPNLSYDLNNVKQQMALIFGFEPPVDNKWDRIRNDFISDIKRVQESKQGQKSE